MNELARQVGERLTALGLWQAGMRVVDPNGEHWLVAEARDGRMYWLTQECQYPHPSGIEPSDGILRLMTPDLTDWPTIGALLGLCWAHPPPAVLEVPEPHAQSVGAAVARAFIALYPEEGKS